jgi:hypothetical protein
MKAANPSNTKAVYFLALAALIILIANVCFAETEELHLTSEELRAKLIDDYLALAESLTIRAGGAAQSAYYAKDIYVCKNFAGRVLRLGAQNLRIEGYPGAEIHMPANLEPEDCAPYDYGIAWVNAGLDDGNPFYEAASFRYDLALTPEENKQAAREVLSQAKRGDFFQVKITSEYGVTPHTLIFCEDYDAVNGILTCTDSNFDGYYVGGVRYGYVYYGAERSAEWFANALCHSWHGATLYRLRDDIVYVEK